MKTEQLVSLSRIASRLNTSPVAVMNASRQMNLPPRLWLDDAPFFPAEAVSKFQKRMDQANAGTFRQKDDR